MADVNKLVLNGVTYDFVDAATQAMMAKPYAAKRYEVGELAIQNSKLYRCKTKISSAETWNPDHWEETDLGDEFTNMKEDVEDAVDAQLAEMEGDVTDLKSAMLDVQDELGLIGGYVDYGSGCPLIISDADGIEVDLSFDTATKCFVTNKNICNIGTVTISRSKTYTLPFEYPAGKYVFSAVVESTDTDASTCLVILQTSGGTNVQDKQISRSSGRTSVAFTAASAFKKINIMASDNYSHSASDTVTITNAQLEYAEQATDYVAYDGEELNVGDAGSLTLEYTPTLIFTDDFSDVSGSSISGEPDPVIPKIEDEIDDLDERVTALEDSEDDNFEQVNPVNLFDKDDFSTSDYLDNSYVLSNGTIGTNQTSYSAWMVTGKIPVEEQKKYTIKPAPWGDASGNNRGRGYDASDNPTTALTFTVNEDGSVTIETSASTKYVRFSYYKNTRTFADSIGAFEQSFILVEGETAPAGYVPYHDPYVKVNAMVEPASLLSPQFVLPQTYGQKIVNFGDSIFGNIRPPFDLSSKIANYTGATVYNCAFGGCRMSKHTGHWDAFSMYRLAYAVANNDFSLQDAALAYDDRTSYAEVPLATLEAVDFGDVDLITIAYGTNDYGGGTTQIDNANDQMDTETLAGALRYSLDQLLTAYPTIPIVVLGIIYRTISGESSDIHENNLGQTIPQYNAKLKEVCDQFHVPFVDTYNIGFNTYTKDTYYLDGTHPNNAGLEVYAKYIARALT